MSKEHESTTCWLFQLEINEEKLLYINIFVHIKTERNFQSKFLRLISFLFLKNCLVQWTIILYYYREDVIFVE